MCGNIKQLQKTEMRATTQFVRQVSGYRKPSKVNEAAFERALEDVTVPTQKLLGTLVTK